MTFTAQLGTPLSYLGNIELGVIPVGPAVIVVGGRARVSGSPMRLCVINRVAEEGVMLTASSATQYNPVENLLTPERPMFPWRTTAAGDQYVVIDFQEPIVITGIWLVNANFTQVLVQGNTVDDWTWSIAPLSYTLTTARSPWNFRYQLAAQIANFLYRYMRIFIPAQSPTDGTSAYLLGGIYTGQLERLPQNPLFDIQFTSVHPHRDVIEQFQEWRQRLVMGEPFVRLEITRAIRYSKLAPAYGDDLRTWLDIERRIRENRNTFALMLGTPNTSQGMVVRSVHDGPQDWTIRSLLRTNSPWNLEEAMGPV